MRRRTFFKTAAWAGLGAVATYHAIAQEEPQERKESNLYGLAALLDGSGFAPIPAGEFLMGSSTGNADERPMHAVRISQPFQMGKFEVTQAQWEAVMRSAHARPGSESRSSHFKGSLQPMENVSWDDVQRFLAALNARDNRFIHRLPTEAEWEYACRAGRTGDYAGSLDAMAWYEVNSDGQTHPVGQRQPNDWGLFDMHGNVWEWVQDWYGFDYYEHSPKVDPTGPVSGSYRVYRGGCWFGSARYCRSAVRGFDFPGGRYYSVGFRLVRTPK